LIFIASFQIASKTQLRHRWMERKIKVKAAKKRGGRDEIKYGKWMQKEEFVNEPIFKMIPAAVVCNA
jgi:hypothetical protein